MILLTAEPIIESFFESFTPKTPKTVAIILIEHNADSERFVTMKQARAARYGVEARLVRLPETVTEAELVQAIGNLNDESEVDAVILQLPVPKHISFESTLAKIRPAKDVDDLTCKGIFTSPMVQAVDALKRHYGLDFTDKKIVVIGQGHLVGKPITQYLRGRGYEPICLDDTTQNNDAQIRQADVIFGCSGATHVVHAKNTKEGQIIFDCSGRDVDFESVKDKVAAITPPKGAIGPLTVHFLLTNTLKSPAGHTSLLA